jgi:hypothetical protein
MYSIASCILVFAVTAGDAFLKSELCEQAAKQAPRMTASSFAVADLIEFPPRRV